MKRNKIMPMMFAAVAILALAPAVQADKKVIISHSHDHPVVRSHAGIGVWIGRHGRPMHHPPVHREVVIGHRPWHRRVIRIGPPVVIHPPVVVPPPVVIHPPVERRVVIDHAPVVTVKTPAPVIEESTITVWITNSNGSRSSVQLRRQGPWYIGPRGEYYTEMPTNEQLRVAYGF